MIYVINFFENYIILILHAIFFYQYLKVMSNIQVPTI